MISFKLAVVAIIIFLNCSSCSPVQEKKARREGGRDGSCSKEECSNSRKQLKITNDCIRAPFCVRQFVRDLKKTVKEKAIIERSNKQDSEVVKELRDQINTEAESKKKLDEQYLTMSNEFENLKQREAALRQTNLGMEVEKRALLKRNNKLEDKFKDLKLKLEEIEKHSANIYAVSAEKEKVENELNEMKTKHQVQEKRIENIVKSLELIENQNALNSQNLANVMEENLELKSALDVLKAQNEHLKSKEDTRSDEVEKSKLALKECEDKFVDLESVNSNCKTKIGELNVCKNEISKLSKIVEERLVQVEASKEDATSFKRRNDLLEKDLKLATDELDSFTSHMEKKSRHIENLQSRLDDCEKEQKEILNKSEEVKMQECESPCTISRNENNDLITLSDVQNKNEKLKDEN